MNMYEFFKKCGVEYYGSDYWEKLKNRDVSMAFLYEAFEDELDCRVPKGYKGTDEEFNRLVEKYLELDVDEKIELYILIRYFNYEFNEELIDKACDRDHFEGVYYDDNEWVDEMIEEGALYLGVERSEVEKNIRDRGYLNIFNFLDTQQIAETLFMTDCSKFESKVLNCGIYFHV